MLMQNTLRNGHTIAEYSNGSVELGGINAEIK